MERKGKETVMPHSLKCVC